MNEPNTQTTYLKLKSVESTSQQVGRKGTILLDTLKTVGDAFFHVQDVFTLDTLETDRKDGLLVSCVESANDLTAHDGMVQ